MLFVLLAFLFELCKSGSDYERSLEEKRNKNQHSSHCFVYLIVIIKVKVTKALSFCFDFRDEKNNSFSPKQNFQFYNSAENLHIKINFNTHFSREILHKKWSFTVITCRMHNTQFEIIVTRKLMEVERGRW
jgi:hypothetical protein